MRKTLRLLLAGLLLLCSTWLFAQEKNISGTVLADDDESPLEGVTITNQRTKKQITTGANGTYIILAQKGDVIAFTYVGYNKIQVTVGDDATYPVKLVAAKGTMQDVVVTAYGQKRGRKELPYSVAEVKGEEIAQTRRDNFLNALAGRVPGATITSTSGLPGASSTIVLRGATSIGGNNQPLFVVDGVPYDNQTLNQENLVGASNPSGIGFANRNGDYGNRAMDINPEDIETVTILKGPEATALYGSQGAAGVVLITTKRGKAGKGTITYDNNFGFAKLYRFPEVQKVYGRGTNGVKDNNVGTYFGEKYPEGTQFYDNFDAFFRTGFQQQHSLSFEGGTQGTTYRLSGSFLDNNGVVPSSAFKRSTVRLTSSTKISNKLTVQASGTYTNSVTDKVSKGAGSYFISLMYWPSDNDVSNYLLPNGSRKTLRNVAYGSEADNPFWDVNKNNGEDKVNRLQGSVNLTYEPVKWLTINGIAGYDGYSTEGIFASHPQSQYGSFTNGFVSLYDQITTNLNYQGRITARKKWGDFNNTLVAGANIDDYRTKIDAFKGEQFFEADFLNINNTKPESRDARTGLFRSRNVRLYSNYVLNYKYLNLSLSYTTEGDSKLTSKFYPGKSPWFDYASIGANIVPTDIPAVSEALPWLSFAKLRYNRATSGKSVFMPYAIDFAFVSQITTGGGYALGVTGGNQNLRPEQTRQQDMGLEMKFLKNRLGIDFTYYTLRSSDQILSARSSYLTGYVLKFINGGLVENRGLEIQLTGTPIQTKNFNWDVTLNFDRNVGEILDMPKDLPFYYDSDTWLFGNVRSQAFKGAFTGNLAGYTFQKNSNGDLLIDPATGYPINQNTFENIANRQPDFKLGIINNFSYKGFNLNFNIDIRKGGDVFNANEMYLYTNGLSTRTLDREQPRVIKGILKDGLENSDKPTPNSIAVIPYYTQGYYNASTSEADFIEEVNWLRMRDITLSYRLPDALLKRMRVFKSLAITASAQDLFMITNYTGADPNVNSLNATSRGFGGAGIDYGALSNPRRFNFGVRFQL
ncbi:SusC/RagA family TonB-linked outer membrane protein [Paraflavitalea sp. CAU 1676]|uniref:SusC/RagA family TonB-linked outer membrane protein n=1 Tax=Paraflavitalea sp. CAU 1676 TaxID=3032598 RepID=UPI0023DBBCAE|nr:SusC/RagA family TonB-linked outer membrane protein [Paraflavitalea sp. CAU 1676]MDF2192806.1 SusC/RagA family TonB-linked outer membrane protein [Paraflavitalea sp. CAU 1676]